MSVSHDHARYPWPCISAQSSRLLNQVSRSVICIVVNGMAEDALKAEMPVSPMTTGKPADSTLVAEVAIAVACAEAHVPM